MDKEKREYLEKIKAAAERALAENTDAAFTGAIDEIVELWVAAPH